MQRPPAPKPNTQRQGQQHDPSGAPIQIAQPQAWALSQDLERRLKAELKRRSFWDLEVRRIRHGLQKAYENVMFSNFEFSQANEVEQALWKSTFYKPIEEFRTRMRTAGQAVQEAQKSGAGGEDGGSDIGKQQQKLTAAYLKFLDEAVVFYKRLVWKLQWVYGEAGAAVQIDATVQNEIRQAVPRAEESRDCRSAVHRCLIYLGDLCRYQSQVMAGARIEWNRAVSFYQLAATVLPNSGNPFNQMAVMAYYSNQELRAVYYYFRSLGVTVPFDRASSEESPSPTPKPMPNDPPAPDEELSPKNPANANPMAIPHLPLPSFALHERGCKCDFKHRTIHAPPFKSWAEALPLPPAVGSGGHALSQNGAAPLGGSKGLGPHWPLFVALTLPPWRHPRSTTLTPSEASRPEARKYANRGDVARLVPSTFPSSPQACRGPWPPGAPRTWREKSSNGPTWSATQSEPPPSLWHPKKARGKGTVLSS
eukprot:gene20559-27351_t